MEEADARRWIEHLKNANRYHPKEKAPPERDFGRRVKRKAPLEQG